ncbi:FkbM family methyltransferase [Mucilaginibacter robiniae]|uniref:FkbM family methyltransferase n=1 Tax=Mucilaginibacter robiniae TaxID=2728022 RepID=A0A7L5E4V7_9SPHI|nr:FkbM family methyltransferase [Mucilaginibacter robiniae]QJD95863.1 FkbM family methyltransferase [Mucilaginibacter robiniae]
MKLSVKALKKKFPVDQFFFRRSYSQEGEDMIYHSFFEGRKKYKGFYVDVGAHHPFRYSNTLHFYQQGWKGINIEPTPGAIKLFQMFRKRDINLNVGIHTQEGTLPFYCFNEPALNSFNQEASEYKSATTRYFIKKIIPVPTVPLAQVLDQHLPPGQTIDFLNIDAEGVDLAVLQSNDWSRYQPLFIMVEASIDIQQLTNADVYQFLMARGYKLVAKTMRTLFFKLQQ